MFDALKSRLARRRALAHTERRTVRPWHSDPTARRVLVVLPAEEEAAKEAWRFIASLGLEPSQVVPVVTSDVVTYVPARYISRVRRLSDGDADWLGLPKRSFSAEVWGEGVDVAFCLTPTFSLPAAYLVGASGAAFRIGLFAEGADPFFDLMIAPDGSLASAFKALRTALRQIEPPVLVIPPEAE